MPVHPVFQEIIQITQEASNLSVSRQSMNELRKKSQLIKPLAGEAPPILKVLNHMIESQDRRLILRIYYPRHPGKLPLFLYFHPGFFIKGDIDSHDIVCRQLAHASNCIVVSVNYALAPENPFPAALEDGLSALLWISEYAQDLHSDGRIAIGGENAGGNLAAVLTHELRDKKEIQLDFQVLIYPQTDLTFSHPSIENYGRGYLLEKEALEFYINHYLPSDIKRSDPRVSPLLHNRFKGLPSALIITAEFDPLKDEGEAYANKLKAASVPTTLICYPGMLHGFFQMGGVIDEGKQAINQVGEALKQVFSL